MKNMDMLMCLLFMLTITNGFSEGYDDLVETLLEGEVFEIDTGKPAEIGGFWKCGNCSDIDESRLMYTEDNDYGDEDQESADVEVSLTFPNMRCVTVSSDKPGVVRKLTGTCDGPAVTLSMYSTGHFTIQVYN